MTWLGRDTTRCQKKEKMKENKWHDKIKIEMTWKMKMDTISAEKMKRNDLNSKKYEIN